jgi:hypothetical protein
MFRRPAAATAVLLSLALLACDDKKPVAPTAPIAPAAPALSAAAAPSTNVAAAIGKNAATVCKAYRKKEGLLKADLAKSPNDASMKAQVKAIAAIIADACN